MGVDTIRIVGGFDVAAVAAAGVGVGTDSAGERLTGGSGVTGFWVWVIAAATVVAAAGVVGALGVGTDSVVLFNPAAGFAEVVRTVGVGVDIAAPGEVAEGDVVEAETR